MQETFAPFHASLRAIPFSHILARLHGNETIHPQLLKGDYHMYPRFCHADTHGFPVRQDDVKINGTSNSFACYGCGTGHGLATGFLAEQLGYAAPEIRAFLAPYALWMKIPDVRQMEDKELFAFIRGWQKRPLQQLNFFSHTWDGWLIL